MDKNKYQKVLIVGDNELKQEISKILDSFFEYIKLPESILIHDESYTPDISERKECLTRLYFKESGVIEGYHNGEKVFEISDGFEPRNINISISWMVSLNSSMIGEFCWPYSVRKKLISVLEPFIVLMEVEDGKGYSHSQRVAEIFSNFCIHLGLDPEKKRTFVHYALLHDVGRIGLEQLMLYSPTRLRNFEETGQDHTVTGSVYVSTLEVLDDFIPFIRSHHERYDGHGFPDRLKGEEIPYWVRVLSIVNWYDNALNTVDSEFSTGVMTPEEAFDVIKNDNGKMFDPDLCSKFLDFMKYEA